MWNIDWLDVSLFSPRREKKAKMDFVFNGLHILYLSKTDMNEIKITDKFNWNF